MPVPINNVLCIMEDFKIKYYKKRKDMEKMKMGWSVIFAETPKIVRRIRSAFVYTLAGSLPFANIIAPKFNIEVLDYGTYVGLAMLLAKGLSSLFGVTDEETDILNQKGTTTKQGD